MSRDALDGLMVFDGVCNLCSGVVQLVLRLDRQGAIRFTPLQSPFGQVLAAAHGLDLANPDSFLVFEGGRALEASDAVLAIAARLPAPVSWLRGLRVIPRAWRDPVYRWLARHRYRLLGRRADCMVPTAAQRDRFILKPPPGWRRTSQDAKPL